MFEMLSKKVKRKHCLKRLYKRKATPPPKIRIPKSEFPAPNPPYFVLGILTMTIKVKI